jgi:hypothetical protein
MKRTLPMLVGTAALLTAGWAQAHHSLSVFDRAKTLTITGTIKEFQWTNPHVWIELVSDTTDGMVITWNIEGSSPRVLARDGWKPSLLKRGDKVSLGIHPRKDGASGGYYADEQPLLINGEVRTGTVSSHTSTVP